MSTKRSDAHATRELSLALATPPSEASLQAVILAAGRGSRLGDATQQAPKCLIDVGEQRLIDHQIDALQAHGITDILVVAGYRASDVKAAVRGRARVIINPEWSSTNSLYSLTLCKPYVRGGFIVMNCDVLAHADAGAAHVLDYVDAGIPSTVCPEAEYRAALEHVLALVQNLRPDVLVVEIGASPF